MVNNWNKLFELFFYDLSIIELVLLRKIYDKHPIYTLNINL